jgi:serine/threonine protein kinase
VAVADEAHREGASKAAASPEALNDAMAPTVDVGVTKVGLGDPARGRASELVVQRGVDAGDPGPRAKLDPPRLALVPAEEGFVPSEPPARLVQTSLDVRDAADRYEVVEELGRGGMGEVHLCFDRRIGRQIARKRRVKNGGELKRFLTEASVQGQLEHPTIVPLHEIGAGEDGELYFTMKAIRGRTLRHILAARRDRDPETLARFPLKKLLHALSNISLGVAFAHSRGVIHRDLKPDNLMLGEFGEVYVLDWGVAKLKTGGQGEDELTSAPLHGSATKVGAVIGTAGYMSPEQCTGDAEIDERCDVYALGAILFEVLAGEPLHAGTALERIDSTLAWVDHNIEARASAWPKDIAELADTCIAATMRDRAQRMRSARAFSEAIENILDRQRDASSRERADDRREAPPEASIERTRETVRPPPAVHATPAAPPQGQGVTLAYALAAVALFVVTAVHAAQASDAPVWIGAQAATVGLAALALRRRAGERT